jgi:large subunit ribosomal protein L10
MDKEQKQQVVEEIAARLGEAEAIFAIDYRGISVPQAAELRGRLRDADASFNVVKNRLAKLAAERAGREGLDELLEGPTALTYVRGDVVTAAKAISTFNREHDVLAYKGGFMDGEALEEERFTALARLPALDVMHGQLVGMAASPLTGLVRGLGSMLSGLAVALGQIQEQGLVGGEEVPADEPAAEEEGTEVSDPEGTEVSDPEGTEVSDPEGTEVSDPEGTEVPDPEGTEVPDPEGTEVSDPEPEESSDESESEAKEE